MTTVDDFGIAKAVADQLRDLDSDQQARILRWVSESLGIARPEAARADADIVKREAATINRPAAPGSSVDIKSFVASKDPKSDNQFAATVAYYYRFEAPGDERRDSINADLLQEATRLAGRNRLGDPGKTLRNAKNMGYLDAADRGEFKINSVGENLVAMTLPAQGRAVAAKSTARRAGGRKGKR
jgi:hypothetical protein